MQEEIFNRKIKQFASFDIFRLSTCEYHVHTSSIMSWLSSNWIVAFVFVVPFKVIRNCKSPRVEKRLIDVSKVFARN